MKKLVIAAFAVTIAAVANAAVVSWYQTDPTVSGSTGGNVADGLQVYLINATYADTDFASAWAAGGIDAAITAAGANVVDSTGYTVEGMGVADEAATYTAANISAYYVIVGDGEIFISGTEAAAVDPVDTTNSTLEFTSASSTVIGAISYTGGAAWVQNVPEPTSGLLLLLLGMAGLALKRKRA